MKLTIMIVIYVVSAVGSLAALAGPLRRAADPERKHPGRIALLLLIPAAAFTFPLAGALTPDGPVCWFFQRWGNIFLGYLLYFLAPLLLICLILLPVRLAYRCVKHARWLPKRRTSVCFLLALLVLSAVINGVGSAVARDVQVTGYTIPKEVLGQTSPVRIVLVGDLHIGVNSTPKLYADMTARINEQSPDLVLVAGDIVTSSFGAMRDPEAYAAILRQIEAPRGVYVVYGNHDVEEPLLGGFTFVGAENALRHPEMPGFLRACGWTLLTDEVVRLPELNGLCIAGRRDETRPGDGVKERAPLDQLLADTDPAEPVLLLEHEPADLDVMGELGVDLSLSGHTHDGQIFPGNIFSRIKGPQSYGLEQWGDSLALVTSGVGYYGPPIRVGTISEIVVIDLV